MLPPQFNKVFDELLRSGILMQSDARLPSVAGLVAGGPITGSWWGHPSAHAIFAVAQNLAGHPDVLVTKLVSGKVTYLHRELWPSFLAIACAREPWQLRALTSSALALLERVVEEGEVLTNQPFLKTMADAARELEQRLLIRAEETHTETGAHAKRLETWQRWATRVGFTFAGVTPTQAKEALEKAASQLNARFQGTGCLPWHEDVRKRRGANDPVRRKS